MLQERLLIGHTVCNTKTARRNISALFGTSSIGRRLRSGSSKSGKNMCYTWPVSTKHGNAAKSFQFPPIASNAARPVLLLLDMSMFHPAILSTPMCFNPHVNSMLFGMSIIHPAIFSSSM